MNNIRSFVRFLYPRSAIFHQGSGKANLKYSKLNTTDMRKTYIKPTMNVHAIACADGLLQTISMKDAPPASENDNPPMDVKGDWSDIWDD